MGFVMKTFREIIQREADRQGVSGYRLAQLTGVSMRAVQEYLRGTKDLGSERVTLVADALGLELRPKAKQGRRHG